MVRSASAILIACLGVFGLASAAHAAPFFVVVPNGATSVNGNTSDGIDDTVHMSFRLQWLYGSGQFFSIGGPIWIDQMAFRAEAGSGPVGGSAANLNLYLSTSSRFPNLNGGAANLMSTTFADNVGTDNLLVYSGGWTLSSPGCAIVGNTPCPFDMLIDFDTPFY